MPCIRSSHWPRPRAGSGSGRSVLAAALGRWLAVLLTALAIVLWPASARADGGTIQLADQPVGPYLVTVMTSPSPLRAGTADVSVLVYTPDTKKVVEDAAVTIVTTRVGAQTSPRRFPATHANATNKLFYAANVHFPEAGRYSLTVEVSGPSGGGTVTFSTDVAASLFGLTPTDLVGPAIPILAFVAWYVLMARARNRSRQDRQGPDPH